MYFTKNTRKKKRNVTARSNSLTLTHQNTHTVVHASLATTTGHLQSGLLLRVRYMHTKNHTVFNVRGMLLGFKATEIQT